jgi:agarase
VFEPEWARLALARAREICPSLADDRALVGWVTDDQLEWAQGAAGAGRPSLLQICLSLEPGFPAYHAAWEFVLALHRGRLDLLAHAWGVPMANKEVVRELTRTEQGLGSRGYLRDEARWTREFARRYFTATAAALRAADSNHLVLGCRYRGAAGPQVLAEGSYPQVDVALPPWGELPAAGAAPLHPVFASDVCWVTEDFLRPVSGGRGQRLTTVERMIQRGRAALARLARHPAVAGFAWSRWQDEPGEQPPFARGLVHPDGTEAREHTELLAQFNARADALRRNQGVGS